MDSVISWQQLMTGVKYNSNQGLAREKELLYISVFRSKAALYIRKRSYYGISVIEFHMVTVAYNLSNGQCCPIV